MIAALVISLSASSTASLVLRCIGSAYSPTPRFVPVADRLQKRPSTSPRPIPYCKCTLVLMAPPQVPAWTALSSTVMEAAEGTTCTCSFG